MINRIVSNTLSFTPRLKAMTLHMIIIFLFLVISETQIVHAAILNVPTAYSSLQSAIDAASPGDTIIAQDGLYKESLIIDKSITLVAENFDSYNPVNNTAIIEGNGSSAVILIEPNIAGIVTIRGFVIRSGDDNISAASEIAVEYNYFHTGNDLLDAEIGAGGSIRGNVFVGSRDDAIDLDDSILPLLIEDNRIYLSHDDGIEIRLQNSSAPTEQITITMKSNQFISNNRTGIQFIDYVADPQDTKRSFVISGNLFAGTNLAAIGFMGDEKTTEDLSGADIVERVYTYNNTFYDNHYALSGGDNHVVFNNIFAKNEVAVSRVVGSTNNDSVVAHNLFYQNSQDFVTSTIGDGNLIDQDLPFQYLPTVGADGIWNTVDDDYSGLILQGNSLAVDAGIQQYTTVSGQLAPSQPINTYNGLAPDLGWQEYMDDNTVTSSPTIEPTLINTPIPTPTSKIGDPTSVTYYVDCVNGNDSYAGTSESQAWNTITKASSANLHPGDAILLKRNCTWDNESLEITESGTSEQPIIIRAYGTGELPRLVNTTDEPRSVKIIGSYIHVSSIHAIANPAIFDAGCDKNPVGYIVGFWFDDGAHDNVLEHSMAEGFYAGISIKPSSFNNQILHNELINNRMMSPLDATSSNDAGAFGILIRGDNNEIGYNYISGSDACSYDYGRDGAAIEVYGGSNNNIHHNYATQSDVFTELGNPTTANNTFSYNVFSSTLTESKFLVTRGAESSHGPVHNTILYNNTVYLTGSEAEGFVCHGGCNNDILTMRNNIFHVGNNRVGYTDAAFDEDYNLFWGGDVPNMTPGSNTYRVDPQFVSAGDGDFRLNQDSQAIDSGIDVGLTNDMNGNPVFVGSAPDIGAYEALQNTDLPSLPTNTPTEIASSTPLPTSTPTEIASSTPLPTSTPTEIASSTPLPTSTPTEIPSIYVNDIDIIIDNKGTSRNWTVTALITVYNTQSQPVEGASVTVNWQGAVNQTNNAMTNSDGIATFEITRALHDDEEVNLMVVGILHPDYMYIGMNNRDVDGSSNGTIVNVSNRE